MPNRVRFDGRAARFYEVWYFIFNDRSSGDGFWIRYTLLNPLDTHPEAGAGLWLGYTCKSDPARSLAIRRNVPKHAIELPSGEFRVRIAGATLSEGVLSGGFDADDHSVAWDLEYAPSPEPHYYFGPLLRRLTARRNSVTVPNPRIELSGTVTIDGRTLPVVRAPGHQAHHWGVDRAPRWLWGHCSAFEEDASAVLEVLGSEAPGGLPVAFLNLYAGGDRYLCSGLRGLARNRASAALGTWQFVGFTAEHRIVADITVDPRHVQRFAYVSPRYRSSECWNTQVGDCEVRLYRRSASGERLEKTLHARGTAAAEVHDEDPERIPYHGGRASEK